MPTKGNAGGDDTKDSDLRSDGTSYEFKLKNGSRMTSLDLGYRMPQTVTVRVFNDINSNGIQDIFENGIEVRTTGQNNDIVCVCVDSQE
jgi:hypothetical protein